MGAARAIEDSGGEGRARKADAPSWSDSLRATGAAVLMLLFAVGATWMATDFGVEARRLPLVVGIPLTVMAAINLVVVVREERRRLTGSGPTVGPQQPLLADDDEADAAARLRAAQEEVAGEEAEEGLSFGAALASLAVVTGLFFLLGLIPATVLFTLGFMRFVGGESWRKALLVTVVLLFAFWLFRTLLDVRFYEGWLVTEDYIPYVLPF